jgi:pimeloyl-ACP methyl ester carboxylesterase
LIEQQFNVSWNQSNIVTYMHNSSWRCSRRNETEKSRSPLRPNLFILTLTRIIVAAVLVFFASSTAETATVTATGSGGMVCNADTLRPDRDMALHEQIALTPGGPIGYYRFGQGKPLVLITGYRATLSEWNAYFLAALAKENEVIVFDNRGIGRSASDVANYSIGNLARDTSALIKALGFESVSVLGWSMGGMIAQRLAIDNPQLVNHLVLMSSQPPGHASVPLSSYVDKVLSGNAHSNFDSVMRVLFPPTVVQRAERCFVDDMFKPLTYESVTVSSAVTAAQERLMKDWRGDERSFKQLRQLNVKTLVLTGTEDKVLDPRNSIILRKNIPHAELVKVRSGGHAMMYQYPELLAHQIDKYW